MMRSLVACVRAVMATAFLTLWATSLFLQLHLVVAMMTMTCSRLVTTKPMMICLMALQVRLLLRMGAVRRADGDGVEELLTAVAAAITVHSLIRIRWTRAWCRHVSNLMVM